MSAKKKSRGKSENCLNASQFPMRGRIGCSQNLRQKKGMRRQHARNSDACSKPSLASVIESSRHSSHFTLIKVFQLRNIARPKPKSSQRNSRSTSNFTGREGEIFCLGSN